MSNEIHGLMVKVMKDLTEVGKDKKNDHFGFKYRGIDDAMNNIGAACRKHGVVTAWRTENEVTDTVTTRNNKGERTSIRTVLRGTLAFMAPDGSKVESAGYGVGIDDADKSGNKAMAAAFKYAAFMGLCIPVEAGVLEDADAEGEPPPPKPVSTRKQPNKPSPDDLEAMSLDDLRALSQQLKSDGEEGSEFHKQVVATGKRKAGK